MTLDEARILDKVRREMEKDFRLHGRLWKHTESALNKEAGYRVVESLRPHLRSLKPLFERASFIVKGKS